MLPDFYTIPQAAKLLKLNPETIRRQIRAGEFKAIKAGRDYIIPANDLPKIKVRPAHGVKKIVAHVLQ